MWFLVFIPQAAAVTAPLWAWPVLGFLGFLLTPGDYLTRIWSDVHTFGDFFFALFVMSFFGACKLVTLPIWWIF
jgi:hypothetical protein